MKRFRSSPLAVLSLCVLSFAAAANAALAPYLATIGYDQVLADPAFNLLSGAGQSIAVLDTGIDATHLSFTLQASIADGITGINFNFSDNPAHLSTDYSDPALHGTFVTSVAVGNAVLLGNGYTQSGLAPQANIVAVRVLNNSGSGDFTTINNGLAYIVNQVTLGGNPNNIRVVNMSLGTATTFPTTPTDPLVTTFNGYVQTLKNLGIPVVVASGNAGSSTGLSFPAIVADVISVGSTTADGSDVSTFSNRNVALDLLAPGEDIYGAYGVANPSDPNLHNLYAIGDGTSFATPLVSGSILLINELYKQQTDHYPTFDKLLELLNPSGTTLVDDPSPGSGLSYPLLNIYRSLQAVPEPMSILLLAPTCILLLILRRRAPLPLAA